MTCFFKHSWGLPRVISEWIRETVSPFDRRLVLDTHKIRVVEKECQKCLKVKQTILESRIYATE